MNMEYGYGFDPMLTGLGEAMRFIGIAFAIFAGCALAAVLVAALLGAGRDDAESKTDPR